MSDSYLVIGLGEIKAVQEGPSREPAWHTLGTLIDVMSSFESAGQIEIHLKFSLYIHS